MTTSDWITLGIGSYAATVATAVLIWNILRERRKVTVRVRYAYGFGFLNGKESIAIEVINKGLRKINIQEFGFLCSNGTRLIDLSAKHNLEVESGDSKSYYIAMQEIKDMVREAKEKSGLRITGAYVRDATGIYYKAGINRKLKERFFKV